MATNTDFFIRRSTSAEVAVEFLIGRHETTRGSA